MKLIRWLKGYVVIRVFTENRSGFLNYCKRMHIVLYQIREETDGVVFQVTCTDGERIRNNCSKNGIKVALLEKHGLPFFIQKAIQYSSFWIGLFLSLLLLYQSSHRIWYVEPFGNEELSNPELFCLLEHYGVYLGMPQNEVISKQLGAYLRNQKEELTWVSCRKNGTILTIDMKENDGYRKIDGTQTSELDFVAFAEGEIVKIITKKGMPLVKKGDMVQKDQILISSQVPYLDESGTIMNYRVVDTQGEIWIRHKEEERITIPKAGNEKSDENGEKKALRTITQERKALEKIVAYMNELQKKEVEIVRKNVTIRRNSNMYSIELSLEEIEGVRKE